MYNLALTLWFINVVVDCAGQLAFKAAAQQSARYSGLKSWHHMLGRPWIWLGFLCYTVEFLVWLAFLSLVPLSVGMMLGSINVVVIMLAGRWCFKEKITPWRLLGMLLIALGVMIVGMR